MNAKDKIKKFENEIKFIKNDSIREFATKAIGILPDYFFEIPSSSTGKYHSQYALGNGGLVRHVQACVMLAVECFRLEWYSNFTEDEKDLVIVSLLLHDSFKSGIIQEKYSREDHPLIASNYIKNNLDLKNIISEEYIEIIANNVLSHMGQWRFSRDGQELMPLPLSKMQKLVHFIDYICSRKMFEVNFDAEIKRD